MIVCLCNPVSDREIRVCAGDGCGSFREMAGRLGVAQQCGRCAHGADCLRNFCEAWQRGMLSRSATRASSSFGDEYDDQEHQTVRLAGGSKWRGGR